MKVKKCISMFLSITILLSMASMLLACAAQSKTNREPDQQVALEQDAALLTGEFFATEDVAAEEQDAVTSQVASDLALLENTAFRYWVELESIENETITYKMYFDETDVTDYLQVEKRENGDVAIRITEDSKEDLWVYKENGQVYCNGVRMKDCELSYVSALNESTSGSPPGGMYFTTKVAPMSYFNQNPASTIDMFTTDYENRYTLIKSTYISEVSLPSQIKNLAVASVLNTLVSSVSSKLLALPINASATLLGTAMSTAVSVIDDVGSAVILSYGTSNALSYKIHKFAYKNNNTLYAEYVYAVDSYAKKGFYGDHFVWGVLEEGNAT